MDSPHAGHLAVSSYFKSQITNYKFQTNINDLNSKFKSFGHFFLEFEVFLYFDACNLGFFIG